MKKIKILRIISRLNVGGPAVNCILLTDGLDRDIFVSYLVVGRREKTEVQGQETCFENKETRKKGKGRKTKDRENKRLDKDR